MSSFSYTTATGLSEALGGQVSHDKITRFLSEEELDSRQLWKLVKPVVRKHERDDGVLIFDDTIGEKPHTEENELICWHYDHNKQRSIKSINSLNCVYNVDNITLPLGFDLVKKPIELSDLKTKQQKRRSEVTKNELLRDRLRVCQANQLKYRYVLADSWYSSKENMSFYKKRWKVEVFHKTLKSNTALTKSPTKCVRTQSNHIFMSFYAAFQLECLTLKLKTNHFALRARLYLNALQQAFNELHSLRCA